MPGADTSRQIERCHHNTAHHSNTGMGQEAVQSLGRFIPCNIAIVASCWLFIVCCCVGIYYVWLQQQHHGKH